MYINICSSFLFWVLVWRVWKWEKNVHMKTVYYDWVSFSILCSNPSHLVLCSYLEATELSSDMPRRYYKICSMLYIISECDQLLNVSLVLRVVSALKRYVLWRKKEETKKLHKKINFQLIFLASQFTDFLLILILNFRMSIILCTSRLFIYLFQIFLCHLFSWSNFESCILIKLL